MAELQPHSDKVLPARGFSRIKNRYNTLSQKQKKLADYILGHMDSVTSLTMKELADACMTSETTVMRFLRKLDYDSYSVFRMDLVKEYSDLSHTYTSIRIEDGYQEISPDDGVHEIKTKIIHAATTAIQSIYSLVDESQIEQAASSILNAGQLICYGSGGSHVIAMDAYHKFLRLGLSVFCDSNIHLTLVKCNMCQPGDVVILVSHTGESLDMLSAARNAKARGAILIGITSYMQSSLAALSDIIFFSSHTELAYYTDAMVSRLIQMTILDMVYLSARLRLEERADEQIQLAKDAVQDFKPPHRFF